MPGAAAISPSGPPRDAHQPARVFDATGNSTPASFAFRRLLQLYKSTKPSRSPSSPHVSGPGSRVCKLSHGTCIHSPISSRYISGRRAGHCESDASPSRAPDLVHKLLDRSQVRVPTRPTRAAVKHAGCRQILARGQIPSLGSATLSTPQRGSCDPTKRLWTSYRLRCHHATGDELARQQLTTCRPVTLSL